MPERCNKLPDGFDEAYVLCQRLNGTALCSGTNVGPFQAVLYITGTRCGSQDWCNHFFSALGFSDGPSFGIEEHTFYYVAVLWSSEMVIDGRRMMMSWHSPLGDDVVWYSSVPYFHQSYQCVHPGDSVWLMITHFLSIPLCLGE